MDSKGHKLLARAIEIAVKAHAGQQRWNGEPFILHPMRVMLKMTTVDEKIVAILHDVVEDTDVTMADLAISGFNDYNALILFAVKKLTHTKAFSYMQYIINLSVSDLAAEVKIADLEDNMDITPLPSAEHIKLGLLQKHYLAYKYLKGD